MTARRASAASVTRPVRRLRGPAGAIAVLSATALLLSGCGGGDEGGSPRAGSDRIAGAAEAGMERASSYGFDSAGFVTEEALEQFREASADGGGSADVSAVSPQECSDPLAAVDWAPLLIGGDAARVDFGTEGFAGTGSIEVAEAEGDAAAARVEEHLANVDALLEECPEVGFSADGEDLQLSISEVQLDDDGPATSRAYSWERRPAGTEDDAEGTTVAQILFTQQDQDVVMVSFIGDRSAGTAEFTQIAEGITRATLDDLSGEEE